MSDQSDSDLVDVVLEALDNALGKLARLAPSAEVVSLTRAARAHRQSVMKWAHQPPTLQEREATMRSVLALQSAVERKARA